MTYTVNGTGGSVLPVNGTYDGTGSYSIILNNGELNLAKFATNSTVNAADGKVGKPINISGVAVDEFGNPIANTEITVVVNGENFAVMTNDLGEWTLSFTPETSGIFTAVVSWLGNVSHEGFSDSAMFNVVKVTTNSTINVADGNVGEPINISGVATDEFDNPIANTAITVTLDGVNHTATTDSNGHWILPYTPTHAGNISVSVQWPGNAEFNGFINTTSFDVEKIVTKSTIVIPDNIRVGKTIDITGVVTAVDGKPVANVTFKVTVDGKTYTVTTDSNGRWVLPYKPTRTGNLDVSVSWDGNYMYNGFTNSTNFAVGKGNINVVITVTENDDGSVTIIANATDEDGDPINDHPVDFILNGKTVGHKVTNKNGFVSIIIPANKFSDGKHVITVIVAGGDNHNDGIASMEFTITNNETNDTNKTSNNPTATKAVMKKTGIPINLLLLILCSVLAVLIGRKQY